MPDDIKKFFFNQYDNIYCNDVWVEYTVGNSSEEAYEYDEDDNIIITRELSILDQWLISECELELGEELLMKHWW